MSRQIVNIDSQSRANAEARTFGGIAIVLAILVVLIFFFMNKSGITPRDLAGPGTTATSSTATGMDGAAVVK